MNLYHGSTIRRSRGGFTLIEVLVVVAVVATLGMLVYSTSRSLITKARIIESSTNLRNLAIANAGYQADFGVFCPADDQYNQRRWHGARRSGSNKFDPANGFLAPYLGKSRSVGICPLFKSMVPGDASFEDGTGGYGYNAAYIGGLPGGSYDRNSKLRNSARLVNLSDASRTVMFTTTAYARKSGLQEYPYCEPPFWDFGGGPSGDRPSPTVHFRANGKALVVWCDGHVSSESRTEALAGENPHGGDAAKYDLGWFGSGDSNGYWNSRR